MNTKLDMKSKGFRIALENRLAAPQIDAHEAILALRSLSEIDEDATRRHASRLGRGELGEGENALWFGTALRGLGFEKEADMTIEAAAQKTNEGHVRITAARLLRGAGRGDAAVGILEKCAAEMEEALNTPKRYAPEEFWRFVARLNGVADELAANGRLAKLHRAPGEYGAFEVHEITARIKLERTFFASRALRGMSGIVKQLEKEGFDCERLKDRVSASAVEVRSNPAITAQSLLHVAETYYDLGNEADAVECYIDAYKLSSRDSDRKLCESTLRKIGYDSIADSLVKMSSRSII